MVKATKSEFVTTVMIGSELVEIRRLDSGPLVGFDGAYLYQMGDGEQPNNPYDDGVVVVFADHFGHRTGY